MRNVMTPLVDKLAAANSVGRVAEAVGGRVTGVQVGVVLGFLSGKVLGQFEFFDRPGGQLLLVAPNIVAVERQLQGRRRPTSGCGSACTRSPTACSSPPCRGCASTCSTRSTRSPRRVETDPDALRARLSARGRRTRRTSSAGRATAPGCSAVIATPEQREMLDRITAFMSLVEGHAEYRDERGVAAT